MLLDKESIAKQKNNLTKLDQPQSIIEEAQVDEKQYIAQNIVEGKAKRNSTAHIRIDLLEDIRKIAYWSQMTVTDVINSFLEQKIEEYIQKKGSIKDIPPEAKKLLELRRRKPSKNKKK
jgi:hypothetical protein